MTTTRSSAAREAHVLQLTRQYLFPDLINYIAEFIPPSVSYRWKHPIYIRIQEHKDHLMHVKRQHKDLQDHLDDLLVNSFDPSILRGIPDLCHTNQAMERAITRERAMIHRLNEIFTKCSEDFYLPSIQSKMYWYDLYGLLKESDTIMQQSVSVHTQYQRRHR